MKPETAIASWQHWQTDLPAEPVIIKDLGEGRSNRSFLLDSGGVRMVLRLNNTDKLLPGANRSSETTIWQSASAKGIAPPLLYADEQARFLISAYIENNLPPDPQTNTGVLDQVFELIRQCHRLEVNAPSLNYAAHIENYWKMINNRPATPDNALFRQREPLQDLLESLLSQEPKQGLCHHDPVKANFIGNPEKLYLIDWEYAAHGLVVMDYAALAVEWAIDDAIVIKNTGIDPHQLSMARSLYTYMCALWAELIR